MELREIAAADLECECFGKAVTQLQAMWPNGVWSGVAQRFSVLQLDISSKVFSKNPNSERMDELKHLSYPSVDVCLKRERMTSRILGRILRYAWIRSRVY